MKIKKIRQDDLKRIIFYDLEALKDAVLCKRKFKRFI